jgi:hypothetical protein
VGFVVRVEELIPTTKYYAVRAAKKKRIIKVQEHQLLVYVIV